MGGPLSDLNFTILAAKVEGKSFYKGFYTKSFYKVEKVLLEREKYMLVFSAYVWQE